MLFGASYSTMQLSDATTSRDRSPAHLYVFAAFAVGQAVQTNNGVIHPIALAWIGVALVALVSAMVDVRVRWFRWIEQLALPRLLAWCVAVQWVQSIVWAVRWGPEGAEGWLAASLLVVGIGVALLALATDRRATIGFVLTLCGFALAAVGVIHASPGIGIDVFYFQEESAAALLRGLNPYAVRFRDIYYPETGYYGSGASVNGWLTYSYPYPPLMLLLVAPAKLLLSDVRYAHLATMLASALLLVATLRGRVAMLAAAMLLLMPRNLLMLQVAWTEPMVLLCLSTVLFAAKGKRRWTWVAIGALLAIKQYSILFVPLLPLLVNAEASRRLSHPPRRRGGLFAWFGNLLHPTLIAAACLAIATMLPFVIWSPRSFLRSVALWQFSQPFFEDALSYIVMFWRTTGIRLGAGPGFIAAGACTILAWRFAPRSASGFAASAMLVLLAFFAFNKQAFCNYYTLVAMVGCWAGALMQEERAVSTQRSEIAASTRAASRRAA